MLKKFIFFISFSFVIILNQGYLIAAENNLIPLKKPLLTEQELKKKVQVNLLKPLKKPNKVVKEDDIKEISQKKTIKPKLLLPKKKPLIAGVDNKIKIKKSKYFSKKDFSIAKKSLSEMKKRKWSSALQTAKKAKDKSIYTFIQWRHLLTSGNQASYYEYKTFINKNEDYPRIGRIKYLAEHKLSTDIVSPKKIIEIALMYLSNGI